MSTRRLPPGIRKRSTPGGTTYEVKVKFPDEHGRMTIPRYAYADSVEAAVIAKADLLTKRKRARRPRKQRVEQITVGDAMAWWQTEHVGLLETSTVDYYRVADAYRIAPYLYDRRVDELTRADVLAWRNDLRREHATDEDGRVILDEHGEPVPAHTPRTINAAVAALKACYNRLIDDLDLPVTNPAARIKKLHEPRKTIRIYNPSEVEQITDAIYQVRAAKQARTGRGMRMRDERAQLLAHRDATMVTVLAYTGLRLGELLGLQRYHYDDGRERRNGRVVKDAGVGWLSIEQQVDAKSGKVKRYVKTKRNRVVPVMPTVRAAIDAWLDACPANTDEGFLFPALQPWNDLSRSAYQRQPRWRDNHFKPAAAAAGFPRATPHEMRHTFVSLLIAENEPMTQIAEWAGHSVEVMLNTYAHLISRNANDRLKRIDTSLFAAIDDSSDAGADTAPAAP